MPTSEIPASEMPTSEPKIESMKPFSIGIIVGIALGGGASFIAFYFLIFNNWKRIFGEKNVSPYSLEGVSSAISSSAIQNIAELGLSSRVAPESEEQLGSFSVANFSVNASHNTTEEDKSKSDGKNSTESNKAEEKTNEKVNVTLQPLQIKRNDVCIVGEPLGRGSYGEVYKAEWRHQEVAVKRYIGDKLPERIAREVRNEVDVMMCLTHECLIRPQKGFKPPPFRRVAFS